MTKGTITRLTNSHGSTWGYIQPAGTVRVVFFDLLSLSREADFVNLIEGQDVEFEEEANRVNGTRAVGLVRLAAEAEPAS